MIHLDAKELCLALLRADTEDEVISLLSEAGLWEGQGDWRFFGDREDNYSVIGVQQSRPEAALVEKVVNAVDARLMDACQASGVNPESPQAPQSIRGAVARFFEGREAIGEIGGKIRAWDDRKRREVARGIAVAATGERSNPCFTITDTGEGQSPDRMPDTLLSLDKKNKLRIPFVQGRFNMGGTGVFRFCGKHNLHFVVSRRNPDIVRAMGESDASTPFWGFTVVRRQNPKGSAKNSVYTYLAPLGADTKPGRGDVLRFEAATLPLMPQRNSAYARETKWGTAIKLYEYQATRFRSHILRKDGLLYRLDLLLPGIALPVRLHECRDYGGAEERSYETNMNGAIVRLEDGRHDNLEQGFPDSVQFELAGGERFRARIYAFKKGKAETYRKNEGIVFVINGQTHGYLPTSFFGRQKVKMGRLADSLLLLVDCTQMSGRAREDLFLNSRDRLTNGDLRASLERQIEEILSTHQGLRALRERRRREEIESQLADSKPLEDVLASIIKRSPSLSALFAVGKRVVNPNKPKEVAKAEKVFEGKRHPTFFRFRRLEYGKTLVRSCPINHRCRLLLETDVVNDYFDRDESPGRFGMAMRNGTSPEQPVVHILNLHDGRASLNIDLPEDVAVGDTLHLRTVIDDELLLEPFVNCATITVEQPARPSRGGRGTKKPGDNKEGKGAESQLGIELPPIDLVRRDRWPLFKFDQYSACTIRQDESEADPDRIAYDFHINVENIYLKAEMKEGREDARLCEAQFVYGVVLIGLAIIKDAVERERHSPTGNGRNEDNSDPEEPLERGVDRLTRALAPFILPIIRSLGSLQDEDVGTLSRIGDDE